jgi:hypothetical protein
MVGKWLYNRWRSEVLGFPFRPKRHYFTIARFIPVQQMTQKKGDRSSLLDQIRGTY